MARFRILTLNQISTHGLHRFPPDRFTVGRAIDDPDAIIVRSHDLHATPIAVRDFPCLCDRSVMCRDPIR